MAPRFEVNLGDKEQTALQELQDRVWLDLDPYIYDKNEFVYRFLKAKRFDVDEGEKAIRNTLAWRKKINVASIHTDYKLPEVLQKHFGENMLIGFDKEDSPVYYHAGTKLDLIGIFMSLTQSDIEKSLAWFNEKAEKLLWERSKQLNKHVKNYTYIIDATDMSFAMAINKRTVEIFGFVIKMQLEHYPDRLKAVHIINTTNFFTIPFALLKTFIPAQLLKKFKVHGPDDWKDELLEKIDASELPAFLGGEKTDPDGDPLCKNIVFHGSKVDEKYYIQKSKKSLASGPDVKKLVLSRASFSEIVLEVEEPESVIEWEWETKTRDIGFGLFHQDMIDGEEKITELIPLQRMDTDEFPEVGNYKCEKAGSYIMLFDNSYSWIRSKEIYYKATVLSPAEHKAQTEKEKD